MTVPQAQLTNPGVPVVDPVAALTAVIDAIDGIDEASSSADIGAALAAVRTGLAEALTP